MEQKVCVVCGMPLLKLEDYPDGADTTKVDWCKYCGTANSIKTYAEALTGMTGFIMKTQGMTEDQAEKAAAEMLKNSVAYKQGRLK